MSDFIEIRTSGPLEAHIRPPGSKSITNRALVCAALAKGTSTLQGALDSEDTRVMLDGLRLLGIPVEFNSSASLMTVTGKAGSLPTGEAELFVANSGTTIRFLTALVTIGQGDYRLDGTSRMRERPISDLLDALNQLGAETRCEFNNRCPPVVIHAQGLQGGKVTIQGDISSQFLSGLLMAAPSAKKDVEIIVEGELVSGPYVQMTLAVMKSFGVKVAASDDLSRFNIHAGQSYVACDYSIEPDASAASYFWAAAAITGGTVTVEGLHQKSLQGDVAFCKCLQSMGCEVKYDSQSITVSGKPLRGAELNMNAISDTAQTLAAVALFASGSTTITGIAHNRHKETDRIGDLARELRKLGAEVAELHDGMKITPGPLHGASIDTYNDHRMAMSLALVGLQVPGVKINNPSCTGKTYPHYFSDLDSLRG